MEMKTITLKTMAGNSFEFPAQYYSIDDMRRLDPCSPCTVDGVFYPLRWIAVAKVPFIREFMTHNLTP